MTRLFFFFCFCFFLASCDNSRLYETNVEIENNVWSLQQVPNFEYINSDTISLQKLQVNVRHTSTYPFSNLWLLIHTKSPDNTQKTDTLECVLAQKDGKWLGNGLGDIWDIEFDFDNRYFMQQGSYNFTIEQAMRHGDLSQIEHLPGIMEIGLRIEKSK